LFFKNTKKFKAPSEKKKQNFRLQKFYPHLSESQIILLSDGVGTIAKPKALPVAGFHRAFSPPPLLIRITLSLFTIFNF
jgi:hypothetical protein